MNSITLAEAYAPNGPDPRDLINDYLPRGKDALEKYQNQRYEIITINVRDWFEHARCQSEESIKQTTKYFEPWQKRLVNDYRRKIRARVHIGYLVVDTCCGEKHLIDGNHRLAALAAEGVEYTQAIDLNRPVNSNPVIARGFQVSADDTIVMPFIEEQLKGERLLDIGAKELSQLPLVWHGTTIRRAGNIWKYDLIPQVGEFVAQSYEGEGMELPELLYFAAPGEIERAANAMIWHIGQELGLSHPWSELSYKQVAARGAIFGCEPNDSMWVQQEDGTARNIMDLRRKAYPDEMFGGAISIETGDVWTDEPQAPVLAITGEAVVDLAVEVYPQYENLEDGQ